MKLSEAFALLGTSTHGDDDEKYDRHRPRLRQDGSIAWSAADGNRIEQATAREVAQWVSTLEDNDDLTYAILSAGKRELHTIGRAVTMYVSDARVAFVLDKAKKPNERTVGHIRYPWIDAIVWRQGAGRFRRPMIQLWMHEDFPVKHLGSWHHYVEIEFDAGVDTAAIALDIARRVSAHNLADGSPAWIHERLREQSQIAQLPEPREDGEGLWECPASVACPHGAAYIGDGPRSAEWIGRGAEAPEPDPTTEPERADPSTPPTTVLKRMLARGKSIARERGHDIVDTDDLLLALLIDPETPPGELMAKHDADYDAVRRHIDLGAARPPDLEEEPIQVGEQRLRLKAAAQLKQAIQASSQKAEAEDHEGALEWARRIVVLADESGISTLRATAMVLLGDACLPLDRFNEAHGAYASAATLRSAPIIKKSAVLPEMNPVDVVDEALYGLCRVADKRNDKPAEVAALEQLRAFRLEHGSAETIAWTANQLARATSVTEDYAAAARWAETAREELIAARLDEEAADVCELLARICNQSGESDRALAAADEAVDRAVRHGYTKIEAAARFERARANSGLGSKHAALDEFVALLPEARRGNKWRARAIVIQVAKLDTAAAAGYAIDLADEDIVFYGPRSAEIMVDSALPLLVDDPGHAHRLLLAAAETAAAVLAHPDTIDENVDRTFVTMGRALTASGDRHFTEQAVAALIESLRRVDPARLRREESQKLVAALGDSGRYELQIALGRAIADRLIESLAGESQPSRQHIVALAKLQRKLLISLRYTGQTEAVLDGQEELLGWMRKISDASSTEKWLLGIVLASYGLDLMQSARYPDADEKQSEAISVLRAVLSGGGDCRETLVRTMHEHATLAARTGDRELQRSRLLEARVLLSEAGDADWTVDARGRIDTDLDDATGSVVSRT